MLSGLKRVILWDYPRAGWQYDIIVGLITLFVVLTPRAWFQDQPRIPKVSQIMAIPERSGSAYLVDPQLVAPIAEQQRTAEIGRILSSRTGKKQQVSRIEPIYDSEGSIHLYLVYTRP